MSEPTVGVVIPTYQRPTETVRAVRSVLEQTRPPAQVVVVDDGSSHNVVAELDAALADTDVKLLRTPHTGHPGRARNEGMRTLTSTWVAFLDSDDTWASDKLERQLSVAAEFGGVALCSNARRMVKGRPSGSVVNGLPQWLSLSDLVRENRVINSSVLIRRDVLESVGGVASSYLVRGCEDYATWLRVATTHSWRCVSEELVDYVDEPAVSIRGSEEFVHPGQQAAWLDYVLWRRNRGEPLRFSERLLSSALRRSLLFDTRRNR